MSAPGAETGTPAPRRAVDDLAATVAGLWPGAAVRLVHGRGATAGPALAVEELLVVPDAERARLLVPRTRGAAARSLLRFSAALSTREVAQRVVVAAGVWLAGPAMLRDRLVVEGEGPSSLVAHLGDVLGRTVHVSISVGPVRANRKPVLGIFDDSGRALAYAKVGDTPVAAAHVRGEARALATIGSVPWRVAEPPRVLHAGDWEGMALLVMTALPAAPFQRRADRHQPPLDVAAEVAAAVDGGSAPLADTPSFGRCRQVPARLRDPEVAGRLAAALDRVAGAVGEREVRVGAWHGDFTPWNLARRRGRVQLWDWERFDTGVAVGADLVHFAVNTVHGPSRFEPAAMADRIGGVVAGRGPGPAVGPEVALAYLAELSCRYALAAQDDGGEAIAPMAGCALQVLERCADGVPVR